MSRRIDEQPNVSRPPATCAGQVIVSSTLRRRGLTSITGSMLYLVVCICYLQVYGARTAADRGAAARRLETSSKFNDLIRSVSMTPLSRETMHDVQERKANAGSERTLVIVAA